MPSTTFYADTSGKLSPTITGSYQTAVTFTNTAGSITAFSPTAYAGPLEIPITLAGSTVTSIGTNAFINCTGLTSVTFASGSQLASIGLQAFNGCAVLTSIIIPDTVTSIGGNAFGSCSKLETVTFGSGSQLLTISNEAFSQCAKLASITIPASVTSIGIQAFYYCTKLATVTFGSGSQLTTIGNEAFTSCTSLTSITIPILVTSIAATAFTNSGLTNVNVSVGFLTLANAGSNKSFYGRPSGVTIVRYKLFKSTGALTGATAQLDSATLAIIESYSSIGGYAFANATSLTSIIIPSSVTSIGNFAFNNCALTSINIPASVTTIGDSAFSFCYNLTSIVIPASVTTINMSAFAATSLTSIIIPASITSIGGSAFYNCGNLAKVTFASGSRLLTIMTEAFRGCSVLKSIVIPSLVTSIGGNAFQDSGLTTMYVSTKNKLGLTPSAVMPLYGKTFTIRFAPPPFASLPICFLAGSIVTTDQEDTAIEKLRPNFHTILGKKIVSIMTSHPAQKLMYKGKIVSASDLVEGYQEPTPDLFHDKRHDWLHYLYLVRLRDSRTGRR